MHQFPESEQAKLLRKMFQRKTQMLELFQSEAMILLLQFLSNTKADKIDELMRADLDPASFHKTQGLLQGIELVTEIPTMLEHYNLNEQSK